MPSIAYHLHLPDALTSSVVFASPHSGRDYAASFLNTSILDRHVIRSSEDAWVDRLFDSAPDFGAPLLRAGAPRAYVDLNRAIDELDPALIEGVRRQFHHVSGLFNLAHVRLWLDVEYCRTRLQRLSTDTVDSRLSRSH